MRKTFKHNNIKKYNKTRKKYKKAIKGGGEKNVPITSIFLTDPIYTAIKELNPEFVPKGFKKDPGSHGFKLHKLAENQNLTKPISVKPYNKIPGYYSIINGRHRFAKIAARGNTIIKVNTINS